ncbi:DUF488 domain-containing protein [Vreelandella jeotgali]|uniref:DUF488 domain-containing protein n=1 Tax=Vreelandella jeotgali TaxID=553386 RepID=UPI00034671A8|nr:DUF488 family protein [Halomonas jeotgali]
MSYPIALKRVYAPIEPDDGARVLVDRLWPRGKVRETLALSAWHPETAPPAALRRQYQRDRRSDASLITRYQLELLNNPTLLLPLMRFARSGRLTLLTTGRRIEDSHLPVLRDSLLNALEQEDADDREPPASPPCYARDFETPGGQPY